MRPNKIFPFIASVFLFAALSQTAVFAAEAEIATADSLDNPPVATFVANNSSADEAEVAELKKTLADLQIQLSSMRSGMQDLQAKWVESEMKNLQAQLAALRGSTATAMPTTFSAPEETSTVPAPDETTVKVTSLEDFVGFPIDQSDDKAATTEATTQDGTEVNSILKTADAEIAKLEAILAAKKALNEDESAHAEVTKKIAELKAARSKLAEISIKDAVEKLADAEPDAKVAPATSASSNIIAQADGAVLFQFPRAISRTADTAAEPSGFDAGNLTADVLAAATKNDSRRNAAPHAEWSIFSETSLAIFTTALLIGIVVFVTWLLRNERRLLAATSRRFQQLDQRPNFDLGIHTKKSAQIKNNPRGKNIIQ
ncbi:MAG: hypothetical protein WCV72_02195 [Patescibacteria group bacterium]|jgi:hypothetical protein